MTAVSYGAMLVERVVPKVVPDYGSADAASFQEDLAPIHIADMCKAIKEKRGLRVLTPTARQKDAQVSPVDTSGSRPPLFRPPAVRVAPRYHVRPAPRRAPALCIGTPRAPQEHPLPGQRCPAVSAGSPPRGYSAWCVTCLAQHDSRAETMSSVYRDYSDT